MGAFNGGGGWERFYLSGDIPSPVSMLSNISDVCHHIQTSTMASLSAPIRAVNLLLLCVCDGRKHRLLLLCASANTTQSWMGSWVSYCHPDKGLTVHLVSGESSAFLSFYGPFRGWLSFFQVSLCLRFSFVWESQNPVTMWHANPLCRGSYIVPMSACLLLGIVLSVPSSKPNRIAPVWWQVGVVLSFVTYLITFYSLQVPPLSLLYWFLQASLLVKLCTIPDRYTRWQMPLPCWAISLPLLQLWKG